MKDINKKILISLIVLFTLMLVTLPVLFLILTRQKLKYPNQVLNEVKSYFRNVKGSYILETPLVDDASYPGRIIYQGGITQVKHNEFTQYEFYVDAKNGEVLNIVEL
ncbi:hypothetical protein H6Y62_05710 [Staphylococcus lugdunensis]|uniref:PepSY domain-containing protein n=2 Tax=Staphylococcus TaxID=1279 RepID=A0A4Q9WAV8_STALU|nr:MULTISPECIES: hypothetical protein [Staphylococcus]AMG60418.1 hypothetical protein AL499_00290 [Staphylococcus lugdunensis]ARJ11234.1 hypothetical protein B7466_05480 [Staphylococcus lugdunensis]AST60314.1 hypothetical protein BFP67_05650 [Staphylococcus lugdunensis]ATG68655.1 hypothetical protein CPG32_03280 [Staphylococcus lugdunensis]ATN13909.1 hypothetical protein CRN64_00325 [Staphylococcus lugdunensis]